MLVSRSSAVDALLKSDGTAFPQSLGKSDSMPLWGRALRSAPDVVISNAAFPVTQQP